MRMAVDSYDQIPYVSTPIYETHPVNLAVPGALFGLSPAPAERCRYLELGCASGGNLIPLAFYLPDSEFLGLERSAEHVRVGRALIETLGLPNVRIELADVHAVDPGSLGTFDYIVAHGFYSWVPESVRQRLFEIAAATLAPHGIAYVSYNTLPGWRLRGMLRDLLRYLVRQEAAPRARLAIAHDGLERYQKALDGQTDAVAVTLRDEVAQLRTRDPSYLYHEYLVEENTPFLFSDFMASAAQHGMQYLCESELSSMFSDNLGKDASSWVDTYEDVIAQEQIMDFVRQRMFRQTLLCRRGLALERELDLERFATLAYHASLVPEDVIDLQRPDAQTFLCQDVGRCVVTGRLAKAALLELSSCHPDALDFAELAARARARVRAVAGKDADGESDDALLQELVRLYLRQFIGATFKAEQIPYSPSPRPRASRLARAQVQAGLGHMATRRHKPMGVDAFAAALIGYLDGRHDPDQLVSLLLADIESGRLVMDTATPDRSEQAVTVAMNVERMLAMFRQHGILVSEP